MSVYTVHEPLLRAADALADTRRFVFVRDGFYFWAFLVTPLWMLWRRLWLVLVLYLVAIAGIDVMLRYCRASAAIIVLVGVLISLLIGLEAGTLRRFTLRRRGWRNIGVVSGDRLEDAELRFFDDWLKRVGNIEESSARSSAPSPQFDFHGLSEPSGVIGLFPEPGAPR